MRVFVFATVSDEKLDKTLQLRLKIKEIFPAFLM